MEVYDVQDIQSKKNYTRGEKTVKALKILNDYWLSDYWIAKTILVYQSYICKRKSYKSSEGSVPRTNLYVRIRTLVTIAFNQIELDGQINKERIQQEYKKSLAYEMSRMLSD